MRQSISDRELLTYALNNDSQPSESDKARLKVDLLFVSGMSGAGRSTALKILEDIGFNIVDNLPFFLLPNFLEGIEKQQVSLPLVVGFELKTFADDAETLIEKIRLLREKMTVKMLFLDCQDDVLLKRYNISRHRHPLGRKTLLEGIKRERSILTPLTQYADRIIDTSFISSIMLARILHNIFSEENSQNIEIRLLSFSYRHGLPVDADIVFDARFLENPFYDEELRPLTGKDEKVAAFLCSDSSWGIVKGAIQQMLVPSVFGFKRSGRSYLTIAVGCTGGQHRSVFVVEQLAEFFRFAGESVVVEHRELNS